MNELFDTLANSKFRLLLGGSFVSKFNDDNTTTDYILPENVGSLQEELDCDMENLDLMENMFIKLMILTLNLDERFNYIYKNGEGLLLNLGYSQRGFAVDLSAKHMDNMLWRSTNVSVGPTDLMIGFTCTMQTTYL